MAYKNDKIAWKKGAFMGYNVKSLQAQPYTYLLTNHLLIMLACQFGKSTEQIKVATSVAIIKVVTDTIIYTTLSHKKRISSVDWQLCICCPL